MDNERAKNNKDRDRYENPKTRAKREREKDKNTMSVTVMWPRDGIQQQFKAEGWARNRKAKEGGQESVLEKGYWENEKREERKGKRAR
jgi:hypothetical protein